MFLPVIYNLAQQLFSNKYQATNCSFKQILTMRHFKNLLYNCLTIIVVLSAVSQTTFGYNNESAIGYNNVSAVDNSVYESIEDYIQDYKDMAVSEMHRVRIPASVTLAQAIIESNFGNSYLARVGKNHFGIKCHKSWEGKAVYRDDDEKDECFRSYTNEYESYQDHSDFLLRSRYDELFRLSMNDYRGWAKGLKKAGYATDPTYDKQLIYVIEKYSLTRFDIRDEYTEEELIVSNSKERGILSKIRKKDKSASKSTKRTQSVKPTQSKQAKQTKKYNENRKNTERAIKTADRAHSKLSQKLRNTDIFYYNHIKSVVTNAEATPTQLASAYGIRIDKLCKFNGFDSSDKIPANTKVYLQSKRNKGPKNIYSHKVKIGETMEDIAHHYGIKTKKLYKRNFMNEGDQPAPSAVVFLRGKAVNTPELMSDYEREQRIYNKYNSKSTNNNDAAKVELIQPVGNKKSVASKTTNETYIPDEFRTKKSTQSNPRAKTATATESAKVTTSTARQNAANTATNTANEYVYKKEEDKPATKQAGTYFDSFAEKKVTESTKVKPVETRTSTSSSYFDSYTTNNTNITTEPIMITESAKVETSTSRSTPTETVSYKATSTNNTPNPKHITIQKGDTLYSISKKYGVTVYDIQQLNKMDSNTIKIGQKLSIPSN